MGEGDQLERIVEAKDATPAELAITACNSGVLAAPAPLLFELLAKVGCDNAKREYYLTDIVGLARRGRRARCASPSRRRRPSRAPIRKPSSPRPRPPSSSAAAAS